MGITEIRKYEMILLLFEMNFFYFPFPNVSKLLGALQVKSVKELKELKDLKLS